MYEIAQEQQERERQILEQKRKKRSIVNSLIIIILLIGIGVFVYLHRDELFKDNKNDTKEVEKKDNKETPAEKKEEEKAPTALPKGKLNGDRDSDSVTIKVNGQDVKIEYSLQKMKKDLA